MDEWTVMYCGRGTLLDALEQEVVWKRCVQHAASRRLDEPVSLDEFVEIWGSFISLLVLFMSVRHLRPATFLFADGLSAENYLLYTRSPEGLQLPEGAFIVRFSESQDDMLSLSTLRMVGPGPDGDMVRRVVHSRVRVQWPPGSYEMSHTATSPPGALFPRPLKSPTFIAMLAGRVQEQYGTLGEVIREASVLTFCVGPRGPVPLESIIALEPSSGFLSPRALADLDRRNAEALAIKDT
jgi:hypothetical protein